MVCVLSDGPLAFHRSPEQLVRTESSDSIGESGGHDFDGRDGCGIAPLLPVEPALGTPFRIRNASFLPAVLKSGVESAPRPVLGCAGVSTTLRRGLGETPR